MKEKGLYMGKNEKTINDRVKAIRKTLDLTQEEFAKRIGIRGGSLSTIELGSPVTEQNILLICTPGQLKKDTTVNKNWLLTGKGKMFFNENSDIHGFAPMYDVEGKLLNHEESKFIKTYQRLTEPNKGVARKTVNALLESQGGEAGGEIKRTD
jgi:DNA-binding XRE family transcriptional regulator